MAKVGRPKSDKPREMVVSLRLTLSEYRHIQALAMRRGLSIADLLRSVVLSDMPDKLKQ